MKKILSVAAITGLLATSALAFDVNELSHYEFNTTAAQPFQLVTNHRAGDALIFPAYYVNGQWHSTIRVINTSGNAVVAKVVFFDGKESKEIRDFNLYLSGNDEWVGELTVDENGNPQLVSKDSSIGLENSADMASADHPVKVNFPSRNGYVEVIGMVALDSDYHNNHKLLREDYENFAKKTRLTNPSNDQLTFENGVITSDNTYFPYVKLADGTVFATHDSTTVKVHDVNNALIGDIRITDVVNGKDMVMPAVVLNGTSYLGSDNNISTYLYLQGEKANLADRDVNGTAGNPAQDYNYASLLSDAQALSSFNSVYMPYGSVSNNNNMMVFTVPFKRVVVQTVNADNAVSWDVLATDFAIEGVQTDNGAIKNYGYIKFAADVYNTDEKKATQSEFSPANTPLVTIDREVGATEKSVKEDSLSYFMDTLQANHPEFDEGYITLRYYKQSTIRGVIPTHMMATKAGSRIVTNWIKPFVK